MGPSPPGESPWITKSYSLSAHGFTDYCPITARRHPVQSKRVGKCRMETLFTNRELASLCKMNTFPPGASWLRSAKYTINHTVRSASFRKMHNHSATGRNPLTRRWLRSVKFASPLPTPQLRSAKSQYPPPTTTPPPASFRKTPHQPQPPQPPQLRSRHPHPLN